MVLGVTFLPVTRVDNRAGFIRIESLLGEVSGGGLKHLLLPSCPLLSSTTIGWQVSPYWLQPNFHQKLSRETSQAATTGGARPARLELLPVWSPTTLPCCCLNLSLSSLSCPGSLLRSIVCLICLCTTLLRNTAKLALLSSSVQLN